MKLKLKKYPKRPRKSASNATKENFIRRCSEIDKINSGIISDNKKSEVLDKRIEDIIRKRK